MGVFSVIARIDLSIGVFLIFLSFCTIPAEEDLTASMRSMARRTKGVKENLYPPLAAVVSLMLANVSPCVSVASLALVLSDFHPDLVRALQMLCARISSRKLHCQWSNLGYWKEALGYEEACQRLSSIIAQAADLNGEDRLLCAGCGSGIELQQIRRQCGVQKIAGFDRNPLPNDKAANVVKCTAEDMAKTFKRNEFNKIISVDSVYHFDKFKFFSDCSRLLPDGGLVVVTDVIVSPLAPLWVKVALRMMGIRVNNQWTEAEYRDTLRRMGFGVKRMESLKSFVLARWFPPALVRHLDYSLLVVEREQRKRVAIIGSGMSGCVAAHVLDGFFDVRMFESKPQVNLAGNSIELEGGNVVDVPLRMVGPHYYKTMWKLVRSLGVRTETVNFDVCCYDEEGVNATTETSLLKTVLARFFLLPSLARLTWVVFLCRPQGQETFGGYMRRHGLRETEVYQVFIKRQLSWMLSCSFAMVEDYPADFILPFLSSINPLLAFNKKVLRIHPTNDVLQRALVEDKDVVTSFSVPPLRREDGTVSIGGGKFDYVLLATEASAVHKILPEPWTEFFDKFVYHPSSCVIHTDCRLMPERREDWRTVNVKESGGDGSCMLSVWMNAYYRDSKLPSDVFQTWNAHARPEDGKLVAQVHFTRVVHQLQSRQLMEQVRSAQGKEGFFFCGAYAMEGLGLLEQAASSALDACERILQQQLEEKEKLMR
ncbi:hypothetical protein GUITHDRAFT_137846 [Guillardia theta CCMP2712]|uniref:Methyltransferase type 11 domain-containing protein n=1 Tax=Guillardia theta (strain CCMP2712) TaxID=905079 RepID=L1JEY5_GUITC|nr:hypothetical protein GUITHDRAFT_137846 [Guillardia theta CCMP2712]EKX46847.1 hypothetical protein GUITHDRAFT_137846 [Guillardia theta CCMP2712]|eukprot:XP_005833827.1 hypothetical protein GUITHDRAFT_137846 [Guillardia theta CCMP2712]